MIQYKCSVSKWDKERGRFLGLKCPVLKPTVWKRGQNPCNWNGAAVASQHWNVRVWWMLFSYNWIIAAIIWIFQWWSLKNRLKLGVDIRPETDHIFDNDFSKKCNSQITIELLNCVWVANNERINTLSSCRGVFCFVQQGLMQRMRNFYLEHNYLQCVATGQTLLKFTWK